MFCSLAVLDPRVGHIIDVDKNSSIIALNEKCTYYIFTEAKRQ